MKSVPEARLAELWSLALHGLEPPEPLSPEEQEVLDHCRSIALAFTRGLPSAPTSALDQAKSILPARPPLLARLLPSPSPVRGGSPPLLFEAEGCRARLSWTGAQGGWWVMGQADPPPLWASCGSVEAAPDEEGRFELYLPGKLQPLVLEYPDRQIILPHDQPGR